MRTYKDIREDWIHLRKIRKENKLDIDVIKQGVLGLVIDKTNKLAKKDNSTDMEKYILQAIKSEYKQSTDSLKQGMDCRDAVDILESLLPKTLSEKETKNIIEQEIKKYSNPNMGQIMKELKKIASINMKISSKIVKELLS